MSIRHRRDETASAAAEGAASEHRVWPDDGSPALEESHREKHHVSGEQTRVIAANLLGSAVGPQF